MLLGASLVFIVFPYSLGCELACTVLPIGTTLFLLDLPASCTELLKRLCSLFISLFCLSENSQSFCAAYWISTLTYTCNFTNDLLIYNDFPIIGHELVLQSKKTSFGFSAAFAWMFMVDDRNELSICLASTMAFLSVFVLISI